MKKFFYCLTSLIVLLLFVSSGVVNAQVVFIEGKSLDYPVEGKNGMVVTGQELATRAGLEVLQKGGNAIDAGVTVGFVMAVTLPRAGNIGGGGFMIVHSAKTGETVAIDYREKAPAKAYRDMFLDKDGNADAQLSRYTHLSAGVPGVIAGFAYALEKYGTISLAEALAPAIKYAEEGFVLNENLVKDFHAAEKNLRAFPATEKIFFKADGSFYEPGDLFVQPELAKTLKLIAQEGPKAFYEGAIAELIVKQMEAHGGLMTKEDLANYQPAIREPIHGTYRGFDVFSMCPPSSGGVHIVQILNILEGFDLRYLGHNSAATIHLMAEAMKRAYADRAEYLGDSDFVDVPLKGLTSKAYAAELRNQINRFKATVSSTLKPGNAPKYESDQTTHYSIVDKEGNAVSNTYTINFSFGSGIVVEGAGFLLNNEMDDFSAKPGVPNAYGLVGGDANAVEPNKRMLSSMSPTIVLNNGKVFLVAGSPGGSLIITTTLQVIMNVIDFGMNIQEAVNAPRVHHQWLPDEVRLEKGIGLDTIKLLTEMGHTVVVRDAMGAASSIMVDPKTGMMYGAADRRREGLALGY
ncbi:gamma-glutamyltranspeptidase [Candidatus Vecturithrix granuli]|uniref:Glutathione hydrolase proenzyme n=1 Tax=Vecturithrix granuli TaxID=1499967 RepID=A0A0S6W7J6_VECG1|nr:gamma-glutamyltranspeptidase [Candidatus Vecturithrix granuli]